MRIYTSKEKLNPILHGISNPISWFPDFSIKPNTKVGGISDTLETLINRTRNQLFMAQNQKNSPPEMLHRRELPPVGIRCDWFCWGRLPKMPWAATSGKQSKLHQSHIDQLARKHLYPPVILVQITLMAMKTGSWVWGQEFMVMQIRERLILYMVWLPFSLPTQKGDMSDAVCVHAYMAFMYVRAQIENLHWLVIYHWCTL